MDYYIYIIIKEVKLERGVMSDFTLISVKIIKIFRF